MIDVDIEILRVLSSTSESIFLTKKSNIARINSINILEEEKDKLVENIIKPLDEGIKYLQKDIYNILIRIPIYNYFLSNQNGINLFDSAQLISIMVDIDNFNSFNNLISYAGFTPYNNNYNKKLHKLLLRIGYKLIKVNPKYQFVYENAFQKYQNKYQKYTEDHLHHMAKRIVVRKFLKNLYINWKAVDKNFENKLNERTCEKCENYHNGYNGDYCIYWEHEPNGPCDMWNLSEFWETKGGY